MRMKKPSPPSLSPSPSSLMGLFFFRDFVLCFVVGEPQARGRSRCDSSAIKELLIFARHWTKSRAKSERGKRTAAERRSGQFNGQTGSIITVFFFFFIPGREHEASLSPLLSLPFIDLSAVPARRDIACCRDIARKQIKGGGTKGESKALCSAQIKGAAKTRE